MEVNIMLNGRGYKTILEFLQYQNKQTAIQIIDKADGFPLGKATVCVASDLAPNEVCIKNYGENAGMYESLHAAGVISKSKRLIKLGHSHGIVCELLRRE